MTNWYKYWRRKGHVPKGLCESYAALDAFQIFKTRASIRFTVNDQLLAEVVVGDRFLEVSTQNHSYDIAVEKQPCQFGGYRYFLRCPHPACKQRMRKLYCYRGLFLCRKCLKLGYYTQRVEPSTRLWLGQRKIEKFLEKIGGNLSEKPKWMHWKTYENLKKLYREYEMQGEDAYLKEMFDKYGIIL